MKPILHVCVIALTLTSALGAMPAVACNPSPSLGQVDQALASTTLKGSKRADANALRDYMAEALTRRDTRTAANIETQAMTLMGYQQADGPVSRGGCNRTWVRKSG